MTTFETVMILLASAAGAAVQGCVGIGFGLVAGPALVAIDPDFAPGPILLSGQLVVARHVFMERAHADHPAIRRCIMGLPFGMIAGIVILTAISDRTLAIVVGSATALASAAILAGAKVKRTPRTDLVTGAAVAFSSVTAGLPGPPLVLNFSDLSPKAMRGTTAPFMLLVALTGTAGLALAGEFGSTEVELTLRQMPGVVLGMVIARYARPYLDRSWFRPAVLVVAMIGAIALVARQLL